MSDPSEETVFLSAIFAGDSSAGDDEFLEGADTRLLVDLVVLGQNFVRARSPDAVSVRDVLRCKRLMRLFMTHDKGAALLGYPLDVDARSNISARVEKDGGRKRFVRACVMAVALVYYLRLTRPQRSELAHRFQERLKDHLTDADADTFEKCVRRSLRRVFEQSNIPYGVAPIGMYVKHKEKKGE